MEAIEEKLPNWKKPNLHKKKRLRLPNASLISLSHLCKVSVHSWKENQFPFLTVYWFWHFCLIFICWGKCYYILSCVLSGKVTYHLVIIYNSFHKGRKVIRSYPTQRDAKRHESKITDFMSSCSRFLILICTYLCILYISFCQNSSTQLNQDRRKAKSDISQLKTQTALFLQLTHFLFIYFSISWLHQAHTGNTYTFCHIAFTVCVSMSVWHCWPLQSYINSLFGTDDWMLSSPKGGWSHYWVFIRCGSQKAWKCQNRLKSLTINFAVKANCWNLFHLCIMTTHL